jgi:hypothetical protein
MQETSVQVTDGEEAKEKIAVLINELVNIVEGKVAEFNITDAIPAFITNVEGGGGLLRSLRECCRMKFVAYVLP